MFPYLVEASWTAPPTAGSSAFPVGMAAPLLGSWIGFAPEAVHCKLSMKSLSNLVIVRNKIIKFKLFISQLSFQISFPNLSFPNKRWVSFELKGKH